MPSLADGPCFDKAASNVNADHPAMQTLGFRAASGVALLHKGRKVQVLAFGGGWVGAWFAHL